jgi:hypothetical protein
LVELLLFDCVGFVAVIALTAYLLGLEIRSHRFSETTSAYVGYPGVAHSAYVLLFIFLFGGLTAFLPAMVGRFVVLSPAGA